ncbi:MAG TPA: hypothetical protein VJS63_11515 [Bradyrhizobium sp.]|nr:hypothetical protein [Bradyrhizobium sp.]
MDQQLRNWKLALERFWSATTPDWREIARLVAEIAGSAEDVMLRQAAAQALPSLRNALVKSADRSAREIARRRLSLVRDVLHTLTAPSFGKRGFAARPLTPEEHYRQMLDLPLGRRLRKSIRPISARRRRCTRTVAATATPFRSSPRRGMR